MRLPALFSAFRDAHDAMYDFGDAAGNSKASAAEVWAKGLKAGYCFFMAGLEIYGTGKMLCEGFALAKACRGGCFVAGTPVWGVAEQGNRVTTAKSQVTGHPHRPGVLRVKPVEEVKQGDRVASRDPQTGRMEAKRVLRTTVRVVPVVVSVGLAEAKSGKVVDTLTASREHPFYVRGKGFVPAGGLAIGNAIVTRAGPDLVVKRLDWHRRAEGYKVYNFVVEDDHSYFVGLHNGGAWVHNYPAPPDYRATFFQENPTLNPSEFTVHHAIVQQVQDLYPGAFSYSEIHDISNLRGLPNAINPWSHLSAIRKAWNGFTPQILALRGKILKHSATSLMGNGEVTSIPIDSLTSFASF
jgi:hypothetical protein